MSKILDRIINYIGTYGIFKNPTDNSVTIDGPLKLENNTGVYIKDAYDNYQQLINWNDSDIITLGNKPVSLTGGQLLGITTVSNSTDASNKQYVDNRTIDFIIENGATTMTTNLPVVWRWRKWSSGYMEAWGWYKASSVSFSNTTTGYYAVIGTANFPMELKEAPYCQATVDFANTGSISTSSLSKTGVTLAVWSASSQSRTCNISLYIMAKYSI